MPRPKSKRQARFYLAARARGELPERMAAEARSALGEGGMRERVAKRVVRGLRRGKR